MKKTFCICMVLCILLLVSCKPELNSGIEESVTVNGADLIPADAYTITVSYNGYIGDATEPELIAFQADEQQFRRFCELLTVSSLMPLSADDFHSFSNISHIDAADISVEFEKDEPVNEYLYIYTEGVICSCIAENFDKSESVSSNTNTSATHSSKLDHEPEYFSVSQDIIHQIQKILIPDFEKDYQALTMDSNFTKTDDVNPGDVNEIPLYIPQGRKILTMSDGFIAFNRVWGGSDADSFLRVVKYDKKGNFLWIQNYPDIKLERTQYGLNEGIETKDGGFAFSVHGDIRFRRAEAWVPGDKAEAIITLGWLVKCDKDGNIAWKERLEFKGGSEAKWISESENGDILTAGTCQTDDGEHYKSGDSTYRYTDLLLMKYDKNGKRIELRKYGGSDFDSFCGADYSPTVGWVVWGSTQSCDGDITQRNEKGTMLHQCDFIVVFDNSLNEKWQYVFEGQEGIYTTYAVIANRHIYIAGSLSANTGKHRQTAIFKLDGNGNIVGSKIIDAEIVLSISVATDSTILVSVNPSIYLDNNSTSPQIYRLGANLEIKKTIDDIVGNGLNYKVVPTNDNGFYTVQTQLVKYLPQPPWMNRSMIDSATVLSRYDSNGKLLYRKTYDKNHWVENIDIVIPLPDDRVIIDR